MREWWITLALLISAIVIGLVFVDLDSAISNMDPPIVFLISLLPWLLITATAISAASMAARWRSLRTGQPRDAEKAAVLAAVYCLIGLNPLSLMGIIGLVALTVLILAVLGILVVVAWTS